VESAKREIVATANLDFASIAANVDGELTATVAGVKVGQVVSISAPSLDSGLVATAYVSAANTVTVRVSNVTVGAINAAAQDFFLSIGAP
jgi:hypothetical protein